jgi:hypothetical protein
MTGMPELAPVGVGEAVGELVVGVDNTAAESPPHGFPVLRILAACWA